MKLGRIGQQLANLKSDFDPRNYGKAKLVDLVEKTGAFEVRRNDQSVYVREIPSPATPSAAGATAPKTPVSTPSSSKPSAPKPATTAAKPAAAAKATVRPAAASPK